MERHLTSQRTKCLETHRTLQITDSNHRVCANRSRPSWSTMLSMYKIKNRAMIYSIQVLELTHICQSQRQVSTSESAILQRTTKLACARAAGQTTEISTKFQMRCRNKILARKTPSWIWARVFLMTRKWYLTMQEFQRSSSNRQTNFERNISMIVWLL